MGQEIGATGFSEADFSAFAERLALETAHLRSIHSGGGLSCKGPIIGLELEAWLIDRGASPAPHNQSFLARLGDPDVCAELSRFNIELNAPHQPLAGEGLLNLERHIRTSWERCDACAHEDVDTMIAIGILPTLRESDLTLANMTPSNRYEALNREVVKARKGEPIHFAIDSAEPGGEVLRTSHDDVMIEAATTSFQLHWQLAPEDFAAAFNASIMLSAPLVALAANSPFLFGHSLWHETRIPLFEQAVAGIGDGPQRVTFGSGYASADPVAVFFENCERYAPLLPFIDHEAIESLACLRLHNGTIWRWNRPLVGFDEDGAPHLRIEQRVMPSGPTAIDMLANAAFYYGTAHMLAGRCADAEALLPFEAARANFYAAAKYGFGAEMLWFDGCRLPVRDLIAELVPLAAEGLAAQGVSAHVIERYLDIVSVRTVSGQNGAAWQLAHYARHGDLARLTADYLEQQRPGIPVHQWVLD